MEAIAIRREAIAIRLEAITFRLKAMALRLEAIAFRFEAIATRLDAITFRLEALALRVEAIAFSLSHLESMSAKVNFGRCAGTTVKAPASLPGRSSTIARNLGQGEESEEFDGGARLVRIH